MACPAVILISARRLSRRSSVTSVNAGRIFYARPYNTRDGFGALYYRCVVPIGRNTETITADQCCLCIFSSAG